MKRTPALARFEKSTRPAAALMLTLTLLPFQAWAQSVREPDPAPATTDQTPQGTNQEQVDKLYASSPFIPEDSWMYPIIYRLAGYRGMGFLRGNGIWANGRPKYPFGFDRLLRRFEVADFVASALKRQRYQLDREAAYPDDARLRRQPLEYDVRDVGSLRDLVKEFSAELPPFGITAEYAAETLRIMKQAAEMDARSTERRHFPDVPLYGSHWATERVERLREEGILIGYPGGTFLAKGKSD